MRVSVEVALQVDELKSNFSWTWNFHENYYDMKFSIN